MKNAIAFLLILVFCWALTAEAITEGFPMASKVISADTALVIPAGKEIYGYTLWVTTAAGYMGLYDSKTLSATSAANVMVEDAEATDEQSKTVWFPKPLVTTNGCTAIVTTANLTLYYQK